jgi:NAD(P)H-flavin reductase
VKLYHEVTNGVFDIQEIFLDNGPDSNYFISGPPAMIKAFKNNLITKGVSVTNILTDDWE